MSKVDLAQIMTVGGPVAAIAILAIFINWKIVVKWADERKLTNEIWAQERTLLYTELISALNELREAVAELRISLGNRKGTS
jgi:hypothetical protein